jgi:hypothetical protein
MPDAALLGPWVRRFLMEHLVGERNLARNTQHSYRVGRRSRRQSRDFSAHKGTQFPQSLSTLERRQPGLGMVGFVLQNLPLDSWCTASLLR